MKVAYKKGDLYFQSGCYQLVEILNVSQQANAIKTAQHGWQPAADFHRLDLRKIGRVEYRWFGLRRVEILD